MEKNRKLFLFLEIWIIWIKKYLEKHLGNPPNYLIQIPSSGKI